MEGSCRWHCKLHKALCGFTCWFNASMMRPFFKLTCCSCPTLQVAQSHRQLQQQVQSLSAERDQLAVQHEQREGHLLELQGQLDLLRNRGSESEAWLTNM